MKTEIRSTPSFCGRYYHSYLDEFKRFLLPHDAQLLVVNEDEVVREKKILFADGLNDYIVASDVLGHLTDIQCFLEDASNALMPDGRLIVTQYNALWEPLLRVASRLGLRRNEIEQNWLSLVDLKNFGALAGFEVVRSGTKMLLPVYIPIISLFCNAVIANIWPFTRLGIFHYVVFRKSQKEMKKGIEPSLSIVVPARNEAGTIEKIVEALPTLGSFTEVIFIEGNSKDNTFAEIERIAKKYAGSKRIKYGKQEGKGKGDAVRKGFEMAEGDILAIYDADMTVPAEEVSKFFYCLTENKADFVNGSRLVYPMRKESMRVINFFGNKFFSLAFTWILGQPLKDTLCGTKVLWRKDYEKIKKGRVFFGDFDPFGDFDLLFGAAKLHMKIIDLPIHYYERVYGTTNISRWKHGWLLLKMTAFAARKMKFL